MTQSLILGVLREADPDERRVALVPSAVPRLKKTVAAVLIHRNAGQAAGFPDDQYVAKGATILCGDIELDDKSELLALRQQQDAFFFN